MRFSFPGRLSNAPTIFISYRRDDTSGYAGRLHDALTRALGDDKVRLDVDDFAAGGEFAVDAKEMVARSDVLLALIGKRWAEGPNATRLADPADLLRHEIETALEKGVRVIPVLVDGAKLPDAASLPESLHPLLQRNAFELSERRWDYDVNDLVATLRRSTSRGSADGDAIAGVGGRSVHPWRLAVAAAVVAALLIAGVVYLQQRRNGAPPTAGVLRDTLVDPAASGQDSAGNPMASVRDSAPVPAVVVRPDGRVFGIDHGRFLTAYEREFGDLQPEARAGIDGLLHLVDADTGLADLRWAAYILATIKHETDDTWLPYEELDKGRGRRYGNPVTVTDPQGRRYENTYHGRGYLLLTWETIYRQMGEQVKQERLVYEPDLALEPTVAYAILSVGMRRGLFSSSALRRYINSSRCDYFGARRVVNGTDQAAKIAGYAVRLERILREATPPPAGLRTLTSLYVRAMPGTTEPQLGAPLPRGTLVQELEARGEWKRIAVAGDTVTGWVPGSFLRPSTAADAGPPCSTGTQETTA